MNNVFKRILSTSLALTICFSCFGYSTAFAKENVDIFVGRSIGNAQTIRISDYLTEEDLTFMKNLEKLYPYFTFDKNGALSLTKDISEIKTTFNFDENFMSRLDTLLKSDIARNGASYANGTNLNMSYSSFTKDNNVIQPMVHVSDWKVYFTYEEVMASFFAAAQIGPSAIIAALAGLGTAIGGPVGATIGTIVGYISGADFLYLVLRAAALKKGVYIGLDWDGPFPVPTQGTW